MPVLAWPRHVEQAFLGRRLQALGLGRLIVGRGDAAALLANMQALLNEPEARRAARAFSERHRAFSPARALARAVSAIEQRIAPLEKPSPWLH